MSKVQARQNEIMQIIKEHRRITINELSDLLGVSHLTIRRDLKILEERKKITVTYGGMIFLSEEFSASSKHKLKNFELKKSIAKKAESLVEDNDVIYIGGGSTCIEFAKMIYKHNYNKSINIVTSCAKVAKITSKMSSFNVTLVGGFVVNENKSMVSLFTLDVINNLNFNKAFLGCVGLTEKTGAMFSDLTLAKLKKIIANNSELVVILCDYEKFGKKSMASGLDIDDIDIIVTNKEAKESEEFAKIDSHKNKIELV